MDTIIWSWFISAFSLSVFCCCYFSILIVTMHFLINLILFLFYHSDKCYQYFNFFNKPLQYISIGSYKKKEKTTYMWDRNWLLFRSTWVHLRCFVRFVLFNLYFSVLCFIYHFVPLSFFTWPLHCLYFFNLRLMITVLVSSNFFPSK